MKPALLFWLSVSLTAYAQVVDVNGDDTVGAEEALAVAKGWKGVASASNAHTHLGQSWSDSERVLSIRGSFPDRLIFGKGDKQIVPVHSAPSAPLILENTEFARPDLCLDGATGIVSANEEVDSNFVLQSNNDVTIRLNQDQSEQSGSFLVRRARNALLLFAVSDENSAQFFGDLEVDGVFTNGKSSYRIDHPLSPSEKFLVHENLASPEAWNVYCGSTVLDHRGEASIQLPEYFEALNVDFQYQLTCVGGCAPVYVAEEVRENSFKIAGGTPSLKVCWEVKGKRNDPFAKSSPTQVEPEKVGEAKERYLHPGLFGEPDTKGMAYAEKPAPE